MGRLANIGDVAETHLSHPSRANRRQRTAPGFAHGAVTETGNGQAHAEGARSSSFLTVLSGLFAIKSHAFLMGATCWVQTLLGLHSILLRNTGTLRRYAEGAGRVKAAASLRVCDPLEKTFTEACMKGDDVLYST